MCSFPTRFAAVTTATATSVATATATATAEISFTPTSTSKKGTTPSRLKKHNWIKTTQKTPPSSSAAAATAAEESRGGKETWVCVCGFSRDLTDLCGDFFGDQKEAFDEDP
ncbi:hypothetical protein L6452_33374 [Arctium lappa]|uniref:Uncharacterized protein n=1 Tax=Arctium lappa TaxID=4217 RepID=A0ACB8YF90_ARCLA|nr:hypothetical protein L6452_33374 [Arctium lappa]